TVLIGLIYGIGIFYVSEPDATYVASGLKISSYNTTHFVGLGLIGFTMILLIALAFYLTRAKSGHRTLPKQDPGSTSYFSRELSLESECGPGGIRTHDLQLARTQARGSGV